MGAVLLLLLAWMLQSLRGTILGDSILYYDEYYGNHSLYYSESGEEFPYEDYYELNSTYEYFNYSHFEETRKNNYTDSSGVALFPSRCLFFSATFLHVLHFLQGDLRI